jgi:hypothetical protein
MIRRIIGIMLLSLSLALPAVATAQDAPRGGKGPKLEEKKAEILRHIDEKISRNQQERACVQAAKSHDELRACREKYAPPQGPGHQGGKDEPGGSGPRRPQ